MAGSVLWRSDGMDHWMKAFDLKTSHVEKEKT